MLVNVFQTTIIKHNQFGAVNTFIFTFLKAEEPSIEAPVIRLLVKLTPTAFPQCS